MDRDQLHEIYRRWRAIADGYAEPRVLVGEVWLPDAERFARYLRPDELHTAFNFDFLACPWEPGPLRASIDDGARRARAGRRADDLGALEPRRHPPGHALRPRRHVVLLRVEARRARPPISSAARGARARPRCSRWRCPARCTSTRARSSACPRSRTSPPIAARIRCGCARAASIPAATAAASRCPGRAASRRTDSARDGANGRGSTSPATGQPLTVEAQNGTRRRCSTLYRAGLRMRRAAPWGEGDPICGGSRSADAVLAFAARRALHLSRQLRPEPVELPAGADVLIASGELEGGALPQDTTVWLRQAAGDASTLDRNGNRNG